MPIAALLCGASDQRLWGLDADERLRRQLAAVGVTRVATDEAALAGVASVLVLNRRYLFEVRTLAALAAREDALLECPTDGNIAAAHVSFADLAAGLAAVSAGSAPTPGTATIVQPAALEHYDDHLRRAEPPLLEPVEPGNRAALESKLYGNAYKGITDLVTKWWWPRPARVIVAWCARAGITPNRVTLTGLLLVIAATVLFAHGHFVPGLLCGWLMTLLDTVDGKLARVTVQSSRAGHVLDHGMDIIHPPFWYVYWGLGLGVDALAGGWAVTSLNVALVAGYVGGRLVEAAFHALGRCSMFAWRPFDAWFRLITARRNPCLIIFTLAVFAGRPDWGYLGVVFWTVASTLLMALRLVYAAVVRWREGPLESWLSAADAHERFPVSHRTFSGTRGAYA
ncbi:MAG: CDP-alcohol phosphatidyltransferase family protein [Gammaproteobacteria bacterium]